MTTSSPASLIIIICVSLRDCTRIYAFCGVVNIVSCSPIVSSFYNSFLYSFNSIIDSLVSDSVDVNTYNSANLLAELMCARDGLCEIPNVMLSKKELNFVDRGRLSKLGNYFQFCSPIYYSVDLTSRNPGLCCV